MTAQTSVQQAAAQQAAVSIRGLDFAFTEGKPVFRSLNLDLNDNESPVVILGPSGCGKTTLLRLIAGLLKPACGILPASGEIALRANRVSFIFQEPRLLPWKSVLENVSLPLIQSFGKKEAAERARRFLSLVSLADKVQALPKELSGGQQQRVNLARAFACPSEILLMDEPFQSLDIPLRIRLMDLTLKLLETEPRLVLAVSHDPREAAYLGRHVIVLGESPGGIIYNEVLNLNADERRYGSAAQGAFEQRFLDLLEN